MAPNVPEYAVALPRHGLGGWHGHHGQPHLHRRGGAPPAQRLRGHDCWSRSRCSWRSPEREPRAPQVERDLHPRSLRRPLGLVDWLGEPLAEQVPVDPDRRRRPPLLERHDRAVEGRHAHPRTTWWPTSPSANPCCPSARARPCSSVLPFFHIYGMQVLMNGTLVAGGVVVTMPRFDLEQFLDPCPGAQGVKQAFVVPPIVLALAKHPLVDNYDLSGAEAGLLRCGAAGSRVWRVEAGTGSDCEVVQGYGMTETSPGHPRHPPGDGPRPAPSVCSCPTPSAASSTPTPATDLGVGGDGEIWVRGPQVMTGYLNNDGRHRRHHRHRRLAPHRRHRPRRRRRPLHDRRPPQGAHQVQGLPGATRRAGGTAAHPPRRRRRGGDRRARRRGRRDAQGVRGPQARRRGYRPADIQEFVAGEVAHYKQVRIVEFVDEIPKSASGKILRRLLRDR